MTSDFLILNQVVLFKIIDIEMVKVLFYFNSLCNFFYKY